MDFDFTPEEQKFAEEVEQWLVDNHDPEVMDLTRENFSQLSDTPARRAFIPARIDDSISAASLDSARALRACLQSCRSSLVNSESPSPLLEN